MKTSMYNNNSMNIGAVHTQKRYLLTALSLFALLNYFYSSSTIQLTDDDYYYGDHDGNNNNDVFVSPDEDVDRLPYPPNTLLTRRLAHNTEGLEHLDPKSPKYKRMMKRRQMFKVARKLERRKRRKQFQFLKENVGDIHFRGNKNHKTRLLEYDFEPDPSITEEDIQQNLKPQTICSRPTDLGTARDFNLLQQYSKRSKCPNFDKQTDNDNDSNNNNKKTKKSILLIEGTKSYGRTGNNLVEFLHALQYAQDHNVQLGIMSGSWAMRVLLKMWMAIRETNEEAWISRFEKAFCVKIYHTLEDLEEEGYDYSDETSVIRMETRDLFMYKTDSNFVEYMGMQGDNLRTLWDGYNTGPSEQIANGNVKDMCTGINAIFGEVDRETAIYSVIHSRTLEGEPGKILLGAVAKRSGCDPLGALEMTPEYVKSILQPLGMLDYPIVFITDGQNSEVYDRLLEDPEIGPQIRLVPEGASWVGGDITLAIMSNVFIGNPASTFSGFIAKSRLAMGFGHNYLFRARSETGGWMTICGDDCVFDRSIMANMY